MKKRNWQNSIIAELINKYPKRTPKCRHFLHCGGCSLQDFNYTDQLSVKKDKVIQLFNEIKNEKLKINNIKIFGDCEYSYRTRMDFVVGEKGIGLRKSRRFDEIEYLQECYILNNEVLNFCQRVFEEGIKLGLVPYDLRTHEGNWRYVSVRVNEKNEVMLVLVTKSGVEKEISNLKSQILKIQCKNQKFEIKSIYQVMNDGKGDTNFGETKKIWGDEFLEFKIDDFKFDIGPNTFFQNNVSLVNKLVEKMVDYVDKDDRVLDLYCGVGTLSLPMAKKCKAVFGVELMKESIELAKKNALNDGIRNAEFVAEDVENFVVAGLVPAKSHGRPLRSPVRMEEYNVLMVDPPRKGLEKVAEKLLDYNFEKIIYMSCNPLTLVKDLQILIKKWEIEEVTLWDLYPQTPHVEVLVKLNQT